MTAPRTDIDAERLAAIARGGGPKAPKDPTKPLTRSMRQIINHLSWGGRLYRVQRTRGKRIFYVLEPSRPSKEEAYERHVGHWLEEPRRVQAQTVQAMIEKGYLRRQWFFQEEATRADLLPLALEIRDKTDVNGNWKEGGWMEKHRSSLPPIDSIAPRRKQ